MLARTLPVLVAAASLVLGSCGSEAGATSGSPSAPTASDARIEQRKQRAAVIDGLDVDELIVEEGRALESTRELLARIEDAAGARRALPELVELRVEVAALGARRRALVAANAEPKSRLAYAMQREVLSKSEARIAQELDRLGALEGVRDAIEDDLQPILDEFLGSPR